MKRWSVGVGLNGPMKTLYIASQPRFLSLAHLLFFEFPLNFLIFEFPLNFLISKYGLWRIIIFLEQSTFIFVSY